MNEIIISSKVRKKISEYFNGDTEGTIYKYKSGPVLIEMYTTRFGTTDLFSHFSRWMHCDTTIQQMLSSGRINEFFTTMLLPRNIGKELEDSNQETWAKKRKEAIYALNNFLLADDLELIEVGNKIILHPMEDETYFIGSGGFANVYRIPETNKVVKKLKDEFKNRPDIVSRFKQEYTIINDLLIGINGIIEAYEYNDDEISYTMEYCDSDLKKYLSNTRLEDSERINIILEILNIMKQVHDRNILHRDLSPKNIFIKDNKPIIADFGLGKDLDGSGRTYVTTDTSFEATLEFCDPRVFQGLRYADKQADIYSLGKIINYIFTNNADNFKHPLELISKIATQNSLSIRYSDIQLMINKINEIVKNQENNNYRIQCERMIMSGRYDHSLDDFLLSLDEKEIVQRLKNLGFYKIYQNIVFNSSYNDIVLEKFTALRDLCRDRGGFNFSDFDKPYHFCMDVLRLKRPLSTELKQVLGECIYAVTVTLNRYGAQNDFTKNYRFVDHVCVQDTIDAMNNNWR